MSGDHFSEALFYAVREDYNADIAPGYIDAKNDTLIRNAIAYVEGGGKFEATSVEVIALARAAKRREKIFSLRL